MRPAPATVGETLKKLEAILKGNAFEAEYILCELTGRRRGNLPPDAPLEKELAKQALEAAQRRAAGEPLQYIFNRAYFLDFELFVDNRTLIPRPETELLAQYLCRRAAPGGSVLDVGTGSGVLALAAATARSDLRVTAVDVSAGALEVAKLNAEKYGAHIRFLAGDLASAVRGEKFDFIVANLPYVSEREFLACPPEVRDFEPRLALVAADEGLALLFRLISEAVSLLESGGELALEVGETQGEAVADFMGQKGFAEVRIMPDLTGRPRFVAGKRL